MNAPIRTGRPRIAVTIGDPAGIGPEIALRLALRTGLRGTPVLVGDADVLRLCAKRLGLRFPLTVRRADDVLRDGLPAYLTDPIVLDCGVLATARVAPGQVSERCGRAAYEYLITAIRGTQAGIFDALTTAPLNKAALHAAGIREAGHAEILAKATGAPRVGMMLYTEGLACAFVTCHTALARVPSQITAERIVWTTGVLRDVLRRLRGREPRLAVLALNPHGGEAGAFGREEQKVIEPAIKTCRKRGWTVEGPVAPDVAFLPHMRATFDGFVCQYHDQGHIPFKMLSFDDGVNVTLGLPLVRTSVAHGTAFDIAWKGRARDNSLAAALDLAVRLVRPRPPPANRA